MATVHVVLYAPRGVPAGDAYVVGVFKDDEALKKFFDENVKYGYEHDEDEDEWPDIGPLYNEDLMVEEIEVTE